MLPDFAGPGQAVHEKISLGAVRAEPWPLSLMFPIFPAGPRHSRNIIFGWSEQFFFLAFAHGAPVLPCLSQPNYRSPAAHSSYGSKPGVLTARTKIFVAKPSVSCATGKNRGPFLMRHEASGEAGTATILEH